MEETLDKRCVDLLDELLLAQPEDVTSVTSLTGGVSSDIAKVETAKGVFCVKFALAKLKVAEDWTAPVHRNAAEYAWLEVASAMAPGFFPRLFGRSENLNGFAMEYVAGDDVFLWKQALLKRGPHYGEAESVARLVGLIHKKSSRPEFDRSAFNNTQDFEALRLEPYLRFTASRHPDLAEKIRGMADELFAAEQVLVHGDVSPKNILFRVADPILLDAECATMGDASFDVAFCLNHLILKAFLLPTYAVAFLAAAESFRDVYFDCVDWEEKQQLEARIARLLPMLMLARVDGKSPVEYLEAYQQGQVRDLSLSVIANPVTSLSELFSQIKETIIT